MAQVPVTVTTLQRKFTDLDFGFSVNPGSGDVGKKINEEAIKQSMRNLILTKRYERPFRPNLSSQVTDYLFELFTPNIKMTIERVIYDVIRTYEPRVQLLDVDVSSEPEQHSLEVSISYMVVGINIPSVYTFILERTR